MWRAVVANGTVVEVDKQDIGVLIKITPSQGTRTALALPPDVAETLTEGLMIETVRELETSNTTPRAVQSG